MMILVSFGAWLSPLPLWVKLVVTGLTLLAIYADNGGPVETGDNYPYDDYPY